MNDSRNPPQRISSKLGSLRVTAQSGWASGEVATRASVDVHGAAVGVELDEPTATYIAAPREIDERFAQRALLCLLDIRLTRADVRPILGAMQVLREGTVADDDIHPVLGAQPAGRRR